MRTSGIFLGRFLGVAKSCWGWWPNLVGEDDFTMHKVAKISRSQKDKEIDRLYQFLATGISLAINICWIKFVGWHFSTGNFTSSVALLWASYLEPSILMSQCPGNSAFFWWPFWDGEFTWPFQRLLVTSNYWGFKGSRIESPGRLFFEVGWDPAHGI